MFLHTIHGFDGNKTIGCYTSNSNQETKQFNREHGYHQLNTLFCYDNVFTVESTFPIIKLCFAINTDLNTRFTVGEKVNIHWEGTGGPSAVTENDKTYDNCIITSIDGRYMIVEGGSGILPEDNTIKVYVSRNSGRAIDRMDLYKTLNILKNTNHFPYGCMVMIDREGYPWANLKYTNENDVWRADMLGSFIDLMKICKQTRPDCLFGYYSVVPHQPWYFHCNRQQRDLPGSAIYERIVMKNRHLKPIADVADFLIPGFYFPSSDPNAQNSVYRRSECISGQTFDDMMIDWLEHSIMIMQKDFSGKLIIPLLWYQNYGDYSEIARANPGYKTPGFNWTPELLNKLFVPGSLWKRVLETVFNDGEVTNYTDLNNPNFKKGLKFVASWGENATVPFENASWWSETQKFFKEKNMAEISQNILDALQLMAEAAEAKDVAIETKNTVTQQLDDAINAAATELVNKKTELVSLIDTTYPN